MLDKILTRFKKKPAPQDQITNIAIALHVTPVDEVKSVTLNASDGTKYDLLDLLTALTLRVRVLEAEHDA